MIFFDRIVETLKVNKAFFTIYTLLLVVGLYPLLAWDKLTVVMMVNKNHHPFLDKLFYYLTYLGDPITYGLLLIALRLLKVPFRKLFIGATSFIFMYIFAQYGVSATSLQKGTLSKLKNYKCCI